jgi:hypothetical protein
MSELTLLAEYGYLILLVWMFIDQAGAGAESSACAHSPAASTTGSILACRSQPEIRKMPGQTHANRNVRPGRGRTLLAGQGTGA